MQFPTPDPKPLIAGMSEKPPEQAERIYFFQRSDNSVIAVKEAEAWNLYTKKQQILGKHKRNDFELIGTGDGEIFQKSVWDAKEAGKTDIKLAQEIIRKGQNDELESCRGRIIPPRNMDTISM